MLEKLNNRRQFLTASALGLAATATTNALGGEPVAASCEMAVADRVLASTADWSDGLAQHCFSR